MRELNEQMETLVRQKATLDRQIDALQAIMDYLVAHPELQGLFDEYRSAQYGGLDAANLQTEMKTQAAMQYAPNIAVGGAYGRNL